MPMFNPSRACTVSSSFGVALLIAIDVLAGALLVVAVDGGRQPAGGVADGRDPCSRVSYSATASTNGVTRCTPGYSVPGRTPQNWLTRTPAVRSEEHTSELQ